MQPVLLGLGLRGHTPSSLPVANAFESDF